ncbi:MULTISPECIES: hypothetical protein [unclassified Acidovorax]|uniref:hypothetical protein n=1 Tax=unclassified Acidovorax TaxID=2684926 RepID=UPI000A8429DF|nr:MULTISPECIES: hypothetical protein [unclassified Acidovorax]
MNVRRLLTLPSPSYENIGGYFVIKKLSAFILLAVIVFGAYRGIATLNTSAKEIEKIDAKDIVDALVAESNGKTPKMINDEMRLESVKKNGLQITFLNTVVSASSNEVDPEEVKSIYFPVMSQSLCGSENMLIALSKGVVFRYVYQGNDEKNITEYTIDRTSCGGNS